MVVCGWPAALVSAQLSGVPPVTLAVAPAAQSARAVARAERAAPTASLTAAMPAAPDEASSTTRAQLSALEGHVELSASTREKIQ